MPQHGGTIVVPPASATDGLSIQEMTMGLVTAIALIVCGVLAAAGWIAKKQPNSREMIEKLSPYQGWIGLIVCIWGAWQIILSVLNMGWMTHAPVLWFTLLATGVLEFALGFLLGFALITRYVLTNSPDAVLKGEQLRGKLVGIQIPMGLAGIGLGLWCLIAGFMYHV
jgi:hypothetical protein